MKIGEIDKKREIRLLDRGVSALRYLSIFFIVCSIVLVSFYLLDIYPFGDSTVSVWDMRIIYSYFFEWFQDVLFGDGNIFYSFSKSMGGNMYSTFAGYMVSPISWLVVFFKNASILDFFTFATVVKFGLAGVTALYYLRHRFDLAVPFQFAISIAYAFMLFMTSECSNLMWMDAVVFLPLILLGVYRVVNEGRTALMFWSLLSAVLIDWYNGYMLCLFVILFYIYESFLCSKEFSTDEKMQRKSRLLVNPGRFSIAFSLCVVASAIILLPTALSLLEGKGTAQSGVFDFALRYDFTDIFRSFFLGVYEGDYLPQLYCGLFVLLCLIWYFMNREIDRRERMSTAVFFVFMLLCTWFAPADRVWTGFRDGNSFYCRYVFLISGLMVFIAARSLSSLSSRSSKVPIILAGSLIILTACIIFAEGDYSRARFFIATILVVVLYVIFLCLWPYSENGRHPCLCTAIGVCFVGVVACEALLSCHGVFRQIAASSEQTSYSSYDSYFSEGGQQYDELDAQDGTNLDAFRVTKLYNFLSDETRIVSNEGLVYGYSEISQYNSMYDDRVQNMAFAFGYSGNWNCVTTYNDPVIVSDSILGVRYTASDTCPNGYVDVGLQETQNGNKFYENPYALPLGYMADDDIVSDAIPIGEQNDADRDPFQYQNEFISDLVGHESDCFVKLEATEVSRDDDSITWEVEVPADTYVYSFVGGPAWLSLDLSVNGEFKYVYMDKYSQGIFPMDTTDETSMQTITLSVRTDDPDERIDAADAVDSIDGQELTLYVYAVDMDEFESDISLLSEHPFEIDEFEDGYVSGTCEADEDGTLFTTIPYDAGWTVKVNGVEVQVEAAQDSFIAIPVTEGTNEIEMTYISPGFVPGLLITVGAVSFYTLFSLIWRRKDRRIVSVLPSETKKEGNL